ncbi:S-adenosylmethionine decarboxylase [Brevibacillus sp. B_LB10_24]|uniref:spermine/spermidine synthase domain-containing protein n=1 Tax=Brevibacillus sp. B_LB10_24 TaxID=3380645 RepID=UPI0038BB238F
MVTLEKHLIMEAFGCPSGKLNDLETVKTALTQAVTLLGEKVLYTHFRRQPHGIMGTIIGSVSCTFVLVSAKQQYLTLDFLSSKIGIKHPERFLEELLPVQIFVYDLTSGQPHHHAALDEETAGAIRTDGNDGQPSRRKEGRGTAKDLAELMDLSSKEHRVVFDGSSAFQDIFLCEITDLRLYLNQQLQFSSVDERIYHEALVHPVMELAGSRDRVLILGGGDGLALREVLKYPDVSLVDLVDIDPVMIELARTLPEFVCLNQGALTDRRTRVHLQDAQEFIAKAGQYNIIMIDLPDPADEVIGRLYTREFYQVLAQRLLPGGLIVCQAQSPEEAPLVYWSIARTFESAGLATRSYHVRIPSFGDWGFHLAAPALELPAVLTPAVENRTLPKDLTSLFQYEEQTMSKRLQAQVNSLGSLTLHKLFAEEVGPER